MACEPENVITSAELTGLKADIVTIDDVVESSLDTTTTKSGKVINTLLGQLKLLGYQAPVTYAGSIVFTTNDGTKTVDEAGVVYAPLPSALPFTTSGTFIGDDDARFFVVQGVTADNFGAFGYLKEDNVADMIASTTLEVGDFVLTAGYTSAGDGGGNIYEIVAAATGTDDGGSFIDLTTHQAEGLFPGGLLSRNQFDDDTAFDTFAAAATEFSEFDTIGLFSKGNAATGIHTSARGLLVRQLVDNLSGAVNVCPNGTVAALNAALSNVRVWDNDIRDDPTGQRRAWAIEMHQDGDGTIRSRLSTRSEGTSALKHTDVYHQFNGNNCMYAFAARGGIGLSALSMAWFPQPTSLKLDFQTTEGGESSTGQTNFWLADTTVAAGDEKAVIANDYQYLLCTTPGLTGGTEPVMPVIGTTDLVDNVARWTVRSRIQKAGNLDAVPTIFMDQDGNTVFGSQSPSASPVPFDFALDTNFRKLVSFDDAVTFDVLNRYSTTPGITAAGVSSLDNATQLTAEINQVSTVAVDSGVRLDTAAEGKKQSIRNDGANTLKIWPTNGDNLGAGVNTNVTLAAGSSTEFHSYDSTNWFELS